MNNSKINETRKRSLCKAISFRILEIVFDSLILSIFIEIHLAIGLAIVLERLWNKINFGRETINY